MDEKISPWIACHRGVGDWGEGLPWMRGQVTGDLEYKHPKTSATHFTATCSSKERGESGK